MGDMLSHNTGSERARLALPLRSRYRQRFALERLWAGWRR